MKTKHTELKNKVIAAIHTFHSELLNGEMNDLDALGVCKEITDVVADFKKQCDVDRADELLREGVTYPGFKVIVKDGVKSYEFAAVPEWTDAKANLKAIEYYYKRVTINASKGEPTFKKIVDESGEHIVEVSPVPVKHGGAIISFNKAK